MKTYPKTKHPKRNRDLSGEKLELSVDVITFSESGMLNIGFYDYDDKEWDFHTNTMEDMDKADFVWCYPPRQLIKHFK